MHGFYDAFPAAHGWSADGRCWEFSATPVYGFDVELVGADGAARPVTLQRRERPQLLFDAAGAPRVLYNFALERGARYSFNMATEVT